MNKKEQKFKDGETVLMSGVVKVVRSYQPHWSCEPIYTLEVGANVMGGVPERLLVEEEKII